MTAIIWSKYHCPYCEQAKALLKQNEIVFEEDISIKEEKSCFTKIKASDVDFD